MGVSLGVCQRASISHSRWPGERDGQRQPIVSLCDVSGGIEQEPQPNQTVEILEEGRTEQPAGWAEHAADPIEQHVEHNEGKENDRQWRGGGCRGEFCR